MKKAVCIEGDLVEVQLGCKLAAARLQCVGFSSSLLVGTVAFVECERDSVRLVAFTAAELAARRLPNERP